MPTKQEIAKQKAKFIRDKEAALMRMTDGAAKQLLDAIFGELLDVIGQQEGTIKNDAGVSVKLSTAINQVFSRFNNNKNVDIIREIVANLSIIVTLNEQYFSLFKVRNARLAEIVADTNALMKAHIGLGSNGAIVKGGYLDRLINDTVLKNKVLDATRKALSNNWNVKDYLNTIRKVVVGDEEVAGGLTQHYRTFAHDTYSQFDSEFANRVAKKLDLNAAVYEGGIIDTSRDFCKKKDGQVFTRKEIENFKNDPDLLLAKGEKKPPRDYDPFRDKGRWNCRHYYNWIDDETAIQLRPGLKAELSTKK